MKTNEILKIIVEELKQRNIDNPIQQGRLIISNVLGISKEELIINEKEITELELTFINEKLEKLKNDIPLQYIINNQEFMKLNMYEKEKIRLLSLN